VSKLLKKKNMTRFEKTLR